MQRKKHSAKHIGIYIFLLNRCREQEVPTANKQFQVYYKMQFYTPIAAPHSYSHISSSTYLTMLNSHQDGWLAAPKILNSVFFCWPVQLLATRRESFEIDIIFFINDNEQVGVLCSFVRE